MKTKKASNINTTRLIFFAIALTYNLILGFYLRDFLILSPTLQAFYLLSVLPTLFLTVKINSKAIRAAVYILLMLIACINIAYTIYYRRVFPFLSLISLAIVFMYFMAFTDNTGKDNHKTLHTHKGVCYDFSHLFAALCRSQKIPCYVVDGDKRDNMEYHHTWNRVYFNGSWWNIDVTFNIVQTPNQGCLYGFHNIETVYSLSEVYLIRRIY